MMDKRKEILSALIDDEASETALSGFLWTALSGFLWTALSGFLWTALSGFLWTALSGFFVEAR